MSILIAGDIHGAVGAAAFLAKLAVERKPSLILLLGDLLYHGPRNQLPGTYDAPETARILSELPWPVASLRGNCDAEVDQLLLPWAFAENTYLDFEGVIFMAIHGHQLPANGGSMSLPDTLNLINAHTHVPQADKIRGVNRWNPGSLGIPKGGYPPSYGWFDQGLFEVVSTEGNVIMSCPLLAAA
ncbi:MAG: phosphodiesterase [Deltaproteobacteria bacterium]|jgi:putative phosphoesterase|nr:phosphodiesterase [Deltaproteobacteria bacterium]